MARTKLRISFVVIAVFIDTYYIRKEKEKKRTQNNEEEQSDKAE